MTLFQTEQLREDQDARVWDRERRERHGCGWVLSGPPREVAGSARYQALNSQAGEHELLQAKWGETAKVLLQANRLLSAAHLHLHTDEGRKLLAGVAAGMQPAIATAVAEKQKHAVEAERITAELKQMVADFYSGRS